MTESTHLPVDEDEIDEAAVLRAMDGDLSVPLNGDEVLEVIDRLHDRGMTDHAISERIGAAQTSITSWRTGKTIPTGLAATRRTSQTPAAPVAGARPLASVPQPTTPGSAPSVDALVSAAARSESKRTQALGQKLEDLTRVLRTRLSEERVAAEANERARKEREAAAAEVARLEAELKAAREKVKPFNMSRQGVTKTMTPKAVAACSANASRNNQPGEFPCRKCGRTCATVGGRGRHEASCNGGDTA